MGARWAWIGLAAACTTTVDQAGLVRDGDRDVPGADPSCAEGSHCAPFVIDALPFRAAGDTRDSVDRFVDRYSCAPSTDESGTEQWYAVELPAAGRLTARVSEEDGDGVDVDVHILTDVDADHCVARGDTSASADVGPGFVFVVVDSWANSEGDAFPGSYTLDVDFAETASGDCAVVASDLRMVWSSCAVEDCYESGSETYLQLPTMGPVVKEAHLVTVADDFGSGWPQSFTDGIDAHYAGSEAVSGYAMERTEPWAPAGEGGSEYGQSATSTPLPVLDEAWYITMYWKDRPAKGTRMIVRNPANGRAVVASAGWETGPGSNTAVAGVSEEIHDYLGTGHLDDLEIGFAADAAAPLGPVVCGDGNAPAEEEPEPTSPTEEACPPGVVCVAQLPFTTQDSTTGAAGDFDEYACAPSTDESGPEVVYRVVLEEEGFLGARLSGLPGGVDVDLHVLDALDPDACVDRGHWESGALLTAGTYYVVVDSWVSGGGEVMDGAYTLELGFTGYDDHDWAGLDPSVFEAALWGFDRAWSEADLWRLQLGVIDYSMLSTEPRFWVVDLAQGTLTFAELTSHGSGSQDASDLRLADDFSNVSGSNMSSIGLARVAETYWGSNGYSVRLDGLEPGWNSNDRSRAIVVHAADYATQDFVDENGYLGRSQGCPAVDPAVHEDLIDALADGGGLFKYYPDPSWLNNSVYLDGL
jgi:hypothetical protein